MDREDRLFATVGGCVVVLAGAFFLWSGLHIGGGPARTEEAPRSQPAIEISELAPAQIPAHDDGAAVQHALLDDRGRNAVMLASDTGGDVVKDWQPAAEIYLPSFVSAIKAIAGGQSPDDELGGLLPTRQEVTVREDEEGRKVIAAGTFRRYAAAVDAIADLDARTVVDLYRRYEPQITASSGEESFESQIRAAVDHLLAVEIPDESPEMESRVTHWAFADDGYEQLSEAQKHVLRMGADNAYTLQTKLRELRDAFGWEPPEPATLIAEAEESNEGGEVASSEQSSEEPILIATQDLSTEAFEEAEPAFDAAPMILESP